MYSTLQWLFNNFDLNWALISAWVLRLQLKALGTSQRVCSVKIEQQSSATNLVLLNQPAPQLQVYM